MCVISCQGLAGCVCGCRRWRLWGCLGEVWWVPVGEAGLGGVRTSPPGPSATSARAMTARRREGKVSAWRKRIGLPTSLSAFFNQSRNLISLDPPGPCVSSILSFLYSVCVFSFHWKCVILLTKCDKCDLGQNQQMLFFWAFAIMKCFFGCSGSFLPTQLVNT